MTRKAQSRVFHIQAEALGDAVYIGRASTRHGLKASPFANPFRIGPNTPREKAIDRYRQHLREHPKLVERAQRELKGKRLACWCAPLPCHGDVLAAVADGEEP